MRTIQRCECGTCKQKDPGNKGYIWQYVDLRSPFSAKVNGVWQRLHAIK